MQSVSVASAKKNNTVLVKMFIYGAAEVKSGVFTVYVVKLHDKL